MTAEAVVFTCGFVGAPRHRLRSSAPAFPAGVATGVAGGMREPVVHPFEDVSGKVWKDRLTQNGEPRLYGKNEFRTAHSTRFDNLAGGFIRSERTSRQRHSRGKPGELLFVGSLEHRVQMGAGAHEAGADGSDSHAGLGHF